MKAKLTTIFVVAVVTAFGAVTLGAGVAAATQVTNVFSVTADTKVQSHPDLSGDHLVYQQKDAAGWNIYGVTLPGTPYAICTDPGDQINPAVDGNVVVWEDHSTGDSNIWAYNLATHTKFAVCTDPGEQTAPAISGDWVVWQDKRNGNWDIYGAVIDPVAGTHGAAVPICTEGHDQTRPDVSGDTVVWTDTRWGSKDILGYNRVADFTFVVCAWAGDQDQPAIDGDTVVWRDARTTNDGTDIWRFDLRTSRTFAVCTAPGNQSMPAIDGDVIVWADTRDKATTGSDLRAFDLAFDQEFPVAAAGARQDQPAISGDRVVFADTRSGGVADIWGADLTPWNTSIVIGDGSAWTRHNTLSLGLFAQSKTGIVTQMELVNQGGMGVWEPYWTSKAPWHLTTGDGLKTVTVTYRDLSGALSRPIKATVTVDTHGPTASVPAPLTAKHGMVATIGYRVNDNLSPTAKVTIRVLNSAGDVVKVWLPGKVGDRLAAPLEVRVRPRPWRLQDQGVGHRSRRQRADDGRPQHADGPVRAGGGGRAVRPARRRPTIATMGVAMKLRTLLALMLVVIAAGLAAAGPAAATMVVKTNTVATGPAADADVACADGHVVWAEKAASTGWDIWGATYNVVDGSVGTPYVICAAAGDQRHPRVSGDYVVWQDHRGGSWDIYGRAVDALTPEFPVCIAAGDQTNPDIYTNRIVWQDRRSGDWDIWYAGLNLGTGAIDTTYLVAGGSHSEVTPSVSGNRVVYATDRKGNWDIYSADVTVPDVQSSVVTNAARQDQPCVWGFRVVWRDFRNVKGSGTDIWYHDFASTETHPLLQAPAADQSQPRLYDDIVVFSDWRTAFLTGSSKHGPDIGYYDMTLEQDGPVSIAGGSQNQPAVFGNDVFWIDQARRGRQRRRAARPALALVGLQLAHEERLERAHRLDAYGDGRPAPVRDQQVRHRHHRRHTQPGRPWRRARLFVHARSLRRDGHGLEPRHRPAARTAGERAAHRRDVPPRR